jgi:hypothetical protein
MILAAEPQVKKVSEFLSFKVKRGCTKTMQKRLGGRRYCQNGKKVGQK